MTDNSNFKNKIQELYKQKCANPKIQEKNVLPEVDKIVVIGDIHGDFEKTKQCLKLAGVLEEDTRFSENKPKRYKWIGEQTVIVQIGDQIDRCRNTPCDNPTATSPDENSDIKIIKFFTDLHNKAIKVGGAVYSLVGNHELMNVTGRMDYVSWEGTQNFHIEDNYGSKIYQDKLPPNLTNSDARKWAFQPGNPMAEYLACTRKLVLKIGKYLFVHAGILPEVAKFYPNDSGIEKMNQILSAYLFNVLDKNEIINNQILLGPEIVNDNMLNNDPKSYEISPLWNRQYGWISRSDNEAKNAEACNLLFEPIKEIYKVNKMFIGHTPQVNNIASSCNNGLWFTDVAMSKAFSSYGDKDAQVLLIEKGKKPRVIM